ncbi:MAG: C_GCAxxG_C_C family protein [Desulfobacteraceae bacterium]|nr:C_GCAxxG_C_C family protein [Desulfobacteraceae bacterium]
MDDTYKKAAKAFDSGLYCAESVLKVIAEQEGVTSPFFPRIATGFCSGMSRTCNMCGAISGGILALNMVYGRDQASESVEECYKVVNQLISRFESEFGTSNCQKLLGLDLGTKEGRQGFLDQKLHKSCREYTGKVAQFTREIIDSNKKF